MLGRTHDLAAFTALNIVAVTLPLPHMTLATVVVALCGNMLGGVAPDLDQPTSSVWQRLPAGSIIGRIVHPFIGRHRHLSHSIAGTALVGFGLYYLLGAMNSVLIVDMTIVWWTFMIGYISHLVADAFTTEGVPLLFPIKYNFGIPPITFLRIKTGGIIEKSLVFPGLLLLDGYLFYRFYPVYLLLTKSLTK